MLCHLRGLERDLWNSINSLFPPGETRIILFYPSPHHVQMIASMQWDHVTRINVPQDSSKFSEGSFVALFCNSTHAEKRVVHVGALEGNTFHGVGVLRHHVASSFSHVEKTLTVRHFVLEARSGLSRGNHRDVRSQLGRHDRVTCPRIYGYLDLVPLWRTHNADRTLAHLREKIQSRMSLDLLNVLVDMDTADPNVLVKTH